MNYDIIDQINGTYILHFNKRLELVYINSDRLDMIKTIFDFPSEINSLEELTLVNLTKKHKLLHENLFGIINDMLKHNLTEYEMSRPRIHIRMCYDFKNKFKGFFLMVKLKDNKKKNMDVKFLSAMEYVLQPISHSNPFRML